VQLETAPEALIQQRSLKDDLIGLFEIEGEAALFYYAGSRPLTGTGG